MRTKTPLRLANRLDLIVWQANYDQGVDRIAAEEAAQQEKARLNGSGDPVLLFFKEFIYAALAACSEGDVPTAEEALDMITPEDLDAWYFCVRASNPSWYVNPSAQPKEEVVAFDDGSQLTVQSLRPSIMMQRVRLEKAMEAIAPSDNLRREVFRLSFYPRMAGCSIGDVPSYEIAHAELSEDEINRWYEAAGRVVPEWFEALEDAAQANQQASLEAEKKMKKPRRRSSNT